MSEQSLPAAGRSGGAPTPADTAQMANALRALAMDAVQNARSGHPGMPMGMAEIAVALWARHLKHNPAEPRWLDRDRFVLSNGHGSMLLYALLHLTGYALPLEELKRFRQLESMTPGHPEVDLTAGVETTTGPLGQGLANAVGMALAERLLAAEFNRPGFDVVDHFTWVFVGDGCLMEGISHEVCSLAGVLGLAKLIVIYDDNGISIDGEVKHWFGDDTTRRFEAYGWHVISGVDGHDVWAVDAALEQAKQWAREGREGRFAPTLIRCKTVIGKGAPNRAGSAKAHGEPLGEVEIKAARDALGWPHPPFEIPEPVRAAWDARGQGAQMQALWQAQFDGYRQRFGAEAAELQRRAAGELPADWLSTRAALFEQALAVRELVATRKASQAALNLLGPKLVELLGGSADLTGSNNTDWKGVAALRAAPQSSSRPGAGAGAALQFGRHINYGVREFGMAAMMNGIALHGGYIPYGGTFLTFSDYSRNALRMAALMKRRVIHVFTHDSIGLGEDGPTHQPIEHAASLRLIPNLDVWRPCDSVETAVAWAKAIERRDGPSALLLTRQNLPALSRSAKQLAAIERGGYCLLEPAAQNPAGHPARAVIIATGSEVQLALAAAARLAGDGIAVAVVSMPSTSEFDRQPQSWRDQVLPPKLPRIAVEAGATGLWWKYGCAAVLGIDRFGESAPAAELFRHFNLTEQALADTVRGALGA